MKRLKIMGIVNVTPDSFSGDFFDSKKSLLYIKRIVEGGADIIDVGGESTGPGSKDVSIKEELRRVIPMIEKIHAYIEKKYYGALHKPIISVDTYKAEVARQAIAAGASMVNDVTALRGDPAAKSEMARVIAESGAKIVLMYSKDPTARTTRQGEKYKNVVRTIMEFLKQRIVYARRAGIKKSQIIIDPGMGAFISGDPKYSYEVLRRLGEFKKLGFPILIGASRKSFLPGKLTEREVPTFLAHLVAISQGASIIRAHDVGLHASLKG